MAKPDLGKALAQVIRLMAVAFMVTIALLGCGIADKPSITEEETVAILYTNLMTMAGTDELERHTINLSITLSTTLSTSAAAREIWESHGDVLEDIIAGTPRPLPTAPSVRFITLRHGDIETLVSVSGLKRLATYSGDGWWTVKVGSYGQWSVSELTEEVQPLDDAAWAVVRRLSPVQQLIRRHDVTATAARELVRRLRADRAWDTEWTKRKGRSASAYGLMVGSSADLLGFQIGLARSAELYPDVQEALVTEGSSLRELSTKVHREHSEFLTLGLPEDLLNPIITVVEAEAGVLRGLLVFYDDEEFVRKGRVFDGDELAMSADDFIAQLQLAPDRLQEALILWERAKTRVELSDPVQ